jgi:hypothetical protein
MKLLPLVFLPLALAACKSSELIPAPQKTSGNWVFVKPAKKPAARPENQQSH